jgi:hypothetical protein
MLKLIKREHSGICFILKSSQGKLLLSSHGAFSCHLIVKGTVNKYSYLKTTPIYHKLPNTKLISHFGMISLAQVKMLPPNAEIHHENII